MTFTSSVLLRIVALICVVIWIVLVVAKVAGATIEEILPWLGIGFWILSTFVP